MTVSGQEPATDGFGYALRNRCRIELPPAVLQVKYDSARRNTDQCCNVIRGLAGSRPGKALTLALRESRRIGCEVRRRCL
jgi:hypothetical protein